MAMENIFELCHNIVMVRAECNIGKPDLLDTKKT